MQKEQKPDEKEEVTHTRVHTTYFWKLPRTAFRNVSGIYSCHFLWYWILSCGLFVLTWTGAILQDKYCAKQPEGCQIRTGCSTESRAKGSAALWNRQLDWQAPLLILCAFTMYSCHLPWGKRKGRPYRVLQGVTNTVSKQWQSHSDLLATLCQAGYRLILGCWVYTLGDKNDKSVFFLCVA